MRKKRLLLGFIVLCLLVIAWFVYRLWPTDTTQAKRALVQVQHQRYYQLSDTKGNKLFFSSLNSDSLLEGAAWNERDVRPSKWITDGFWVNRTWLYPSCNGEIVTAVSDSSHVMANKLEGLLLVSNQLNKSKRQLNSLKHQQNELRYYLRVHGVQDMGYNIVAGYANDIHLQCDTLNKVIALLQLMKKSQKVRLLRKDIFIISYKNAEGKVEKTHCNVIREDANHKILILKTKDSRFPSNAYAMTIVPWNIDNMNESMAVTTRFRQPCAIEFAHPGSMVFVSTYMHKGRFAGIKLSDGYYNSRQIDKLIHLEEKN